VVRPQREKGKKAAGRAGFEVIGVLGLILAAKNKALTPAVNPFIKELSKQWFRLMRRHLLILGWVFLVIYLPLSLSIAQESRNLIKNPSFEEGKLGNTVHAWTASGYDGFKTVHGNNFLVWEGGRDGGKAGLMVVPPGQDWVLIDQNIRVSVGPSKVMEFSAWLRSSETVKRVSLAMYISLPESNPSNPYQVRQDFEVGTEWKRYSIQFVPSQDICLKEEKLSTVRVIVQAYKPCPKLYVDDVSLANIRPEEAGLGSLEFLKNCVDLGSEAGLIALQDGGLRLFYSSGNGIKSRVSLDAGNSWSCPSLPKTKDGRSLSGITPVPVRLKSKAIGLFFNQGERKLFWTLSRDEGKTWAVPARINQQDEVARMFNGAATVLSSGRIVGPTYTYKPDWYGKGHTNTPGPQTSMYCWLSDDEGTTWRKGKEVGIVHDGKQMWFEEGAVTELRDGRLIMLARTPMGRLFRSYSTSGGEDWTVPEPTQLAAAYAPAAVALIQTTGDLLCVWNQNSLAEDRAGLRRFRLTSAISADSGMTWKHFRNLESLDDRVRIEREINWDVFSFNHEPPYSQPRDLSSYPYAPGILRCAYPAIAVFGEKVVIAYDYGCTPDLLPQNYIKVKSLPVSWFYEEP
jgi:hypothetical protein